MEAKDRIMTQQQVWDLKEAERIRIGSCAGFGLRDMRMNWDDEVILKAQAEISFKAGGEEEAKGGHNSISFLEGYQEGKRAGIKEVVEWINQQSYTGLKHMPTSKWYAKLEEWGIDER